MIRPNPGDNNVRIPIATAIGCLILLALVLIIELVIVVYRVTTYPQRIH